MKTLILPHEVEALSRCDREHQIIHGLGEVQRAICEFLEIVNLRALGCATQEVVEEARSALGSLLGSCGLYSMSSLEASRRSIKDMWKWFLSWIDDMCELASIPAQIAEYLREFTKEIHELMPPLRYLLTLQTPGNQQIMEDPKDEPVGSVPLLVSPAHYEA